MTSKKVMYSSLKHCDGFIEVSRVKALYLYFLSYEFYMVVRNPTDRFLSFYKNKFIVTKNKKQPSIELFGQVKGVNQVVEILPNVINKDGHLHPQVKSQGIFVKSLGVFFKINPILVFKLESDIETLEKLFQVKIPHKNSTQGISQPKLTYRSKTIVKQLYREDYIRYGYK